MSIQDNTMSGKSANWSVEVSLISGQFKEKIVYMGSDQEITNFSIQYESEDFHKSSTVLETKNAPFVWLMSSRVFGDKKLKEPMKAIIKWNGNEDSIDLKVD